VTFFLLPLWEKVQRQCGHDFRNDSAGEALPCILRHCERSEAIQNLSTEGLWIASLRSQ